MKSIKEYNPKLDTLKARKKRKIHTKDTLKLTPLQKAKTGLVYALLVVWTLIILLPVLGVVIASFNVSNPNYIDFSNIQLGFDNFKNLFDTSNGYYFGDWLLNSLFISIFTMIITVIIVSLTGYAYSRFRFKGRRVSIMAIMLIQMIPSVSALIAFYIISQLLNISFKILPTISLIIIYAGGSIAGNTFVLKGYLDSVSKEIDDSAKIDGCGNFKTYLRVIMPLARPMLMIIALWSFIGPFGDVILPRILLNNPYSYTLPVGLYTLLTENSQKLVFQPIYAAGSLITALPIAVLFIYLFTKTYG